MLPATRAVCAPWLVHTRQHEERREFATKFNVEGAVCTGPKARNDSSVRKTSRYWKSRGRGARGGQRSHRMRSRRVFDLISIQVRAKSADGAILRTNT